MEKQYRLEEAKTLVGTGVTLRWKFGAGVEVIRNGGVLFGVKFNKGGRLLYRESIHKGNPAMSGGTPLTWMDGVNIMLECSRYQEYEREIITAIKRSIENEGGNFLREARNMSALAGYSRSEESSAVIKQAAEEYLRALIEEGFFEIESGSVITPLIPALVKVIQAEFSRPL